MFVCKNICIGACAYITVYGVEDKPCLYGGVVYGATGGHLGVRVAMTVAYFAKLYYSMYVCMYVVFVCNICCCADEKVAIACDFYTKEY